MELLNRPAPRGEPVQAAKRLREMRRNAESGANRQGAHGAYCITGRRSCLFAWVRPDQANGDLDGRLEFIETDPFLFRSPDRETYISFKMNEAGDVEYLLSGSGQHGVYKKLTLSESTLFQENLCLFFISFYLIFFILLVVEIPYIFAKKIAYTPNRIRQTIQILLWLENVIVFSIFGSFYYFVDSYRLMESYDYIIEGNPYDYTIFTLPFVFIFGVRLLTYYTLRGVLDKQLHLYRLIQLGLFLFVSLGFVYWLSYWNLIGYGF